MLPKNLLFVVTIIFLFGGCSKDGVKDAIVGSPANAQQLPGEIVMIFINPPVNSRYKMDNQDVANFGDYEIKYVDDDLIEQLIRLNHDQGSDTVVIKTKRDIVEVQHAYRALDNLSLFFKKGDSVIISYDNLKPIIEITNRTTLPFDTKFELAKREVVVGEDFPANVKRIFFPTIKTTSPAKITEIFSAAMQKHYATIQSEFPKQVQLALSFLDSLHRSKIISNDVFALYKQRELLDLSVVEADNAQYNLVKNILSPSMVSASINKLLTYQNDSLLYYSYYRNALNLVGRIQGRMIKPIITTQGTNFDHKAVYDSIWNNKLLSHKSKEMLLFKSMEEIIQTFPIADIKTYLAKFDANIHNKVLSNYLVKTYHLDFKHTGDISLKAFDGINASFKDVLAKNKGKVVYVDFWATWCAPCVKSLPASKKLHEKYVKQDVAFIYLSKDEDFDRWKKGLTKYGLPDAHNYIIDNLHTSALLEELEVNLIPRYLLYDRKGMLVRKNAPAPDGKEIIALIDKYLTE